VYYLQFYRMTKTGPVEATGDRSVLIVDGRYSRTVQYLHGNTWAHKHGFVGFRLRRGPTFSRAENVGNYQEAQ